MTSKLLAVISSRKYQIWNIQSKFRGHFNLPKVIVPLSDQSLVETLVPVESSGEE